MKLFRYSAFVLLAIAVTIALAGVHYYHKGFIAVAPVPASSKVPVVPHEMVKIKEKAFLLHDYALKKNFNAEICFLADMSLPSGKKRFFVVDMKKDTIREAGLVSHGNCNYAWLTGRKYDNTKGCGCTSIGRYKIGYPYTGRFGKAYKLYGLDLSNNNAFDRFVVLHSYEAVPDHEVDPYPICQSNGCPMVSNSFLKKLQLVIDHSKKPVLLWIFE